MSGLKSPAPTLTQLRKSLESFQTALNPLLAQSLDSLTSSIEESNQDGKLQSAQMHVSMAYIVLDLVWILLKVSGVDPVNHPVTSDLLRVQEYLTKVHKVSQRENQKGEDQQEEIQQDKPAPVDKGKVGRFLRHALGTAASGKKTLFAEDGSVQKVVDAGPSEKVDGEDEVQMEKSPEWETKTSSKAKRQALKAEKALKKASEAITSSRKKHKK